MFVSTTLHCSCWHDAFTTKHEKTEERMAVRYDVRRLLRVSRVFRDPRLLRLHRVFVHGKAELQGDCGNPSPSQFLPRPVGQHHIPRFSNTNGGECCGVPVVDCAFQTEQHVSQLRLGKQYHPD